MANPLFNNEKVNSSQRTKKSTASTEAQLEKHCQKKKDASL